MKVNELNEGVAAVKLRSIKKKGGDVVYDGDPSGYNWNPSQIKNNFDKLETLLNKTGRKFDRLFISRDGNTRHFLAVSNGSPEVVYWFYYDGYGHTTYVYIDWLRVKTKEFLAQSPDEQLKIISTPVAADPAAIWSKDRSIDIMGAAFETMDKAQVDAAIDKLGAKFISAVSKLVIDRPSIHKLAEFVRSLDKVGTPTTKKFADQSIDAFKKKSITTLLTEIKEIVEHRNPIGIINDVILLRKSGFDWPELKTIDNGLKTLTITYFLKELKKPYTDHQNVLNWVKRLKANGYNWPELDTIEKSLSVGNKQISEAKEKDLNSASELQQLTAVKMDSSNIKYIKTPSELIELTAIKDNPWEYLNIKKPSEAAQIAFVKRIPWGIQWVNNPSDKVKFAAIRTHNPESAIRYIDNPTDKMKYESVKANPNSIRYIRNSGEELQLLAVGLNGNAIKYIRKPASKKVVLTAILKKIKEGHIDTPQVYEKFHAKYPDWPEWAIIERSLKQDKLIKEDSEEEAKHLAQINKYPNYIKYIPNPSDAVQIAAVKKYPPALGNIKEPCKAAYITAMLAAIKADQPDFAISVYKWVNEHHPDWPELAGIEQALQKSGLI